MQVLCFHAIAQIQVGASGYLRATAPFLPKTEQVAKEVEMGLEATIRLAEMNEGGDKENRIGMQIANPNLVVQAETLKERVHWNPETPFEEVFENHNLTWLWIGEASPSGARHPASALLWSTPMATRSSMVYSLLLDYHHSFAMTLPFFWAFIFAINLPLLRGWMRWRRDWW